MIQLAALNDFWDRKITVEKALNQGFDVKYNAMLDACSSCEASGGPCGSGSTDHFICIRQNQSYPKCCPHQRIAFWVWMIIGAMLTKIVIICCSIVCYSYSKRYSYKCILSSFTRKSTDDKELDAFINQYGTLIPRIYSYSDIEIMTNHFKEKLGQGGYGEVYRGNIFDKHPVAVKILNITKGNAEVFINEVVSISRTSHVNIVTLVGFCLDGCKRALVYEFMPNGSLEKYICHESDAYFGLKRLYSIAIGIAKGLEYLHGGCNIRILHFDIKPQNILLDEDFCPNISDFGLAKLCGRKDSDVSILGARGTVGYIAPEVFSTKYGGVSCKSDVYSYGIMVLEMVGGRNNVTSVQSSSTNETYFPQSLYHCIVTDEDLKLQGHHMTKEENEIARKMILVGLWCMQTDPSRRPTMSKVIAMMEGSLASLEIPPKPFLVSPSKPEAVSSEIAGLPNKSLHSSRSA